MIQQRALNTHIEREMRIQYACNHPSILKLYGVSKAPDGRIVFIIEYAERTYFDLIRQGVHLSNREKFTIIRELADGLLYIHKRGFIHRDLKVEQPILESFAGREHSDLEQSYQDRRLRIRSCFESTGKHRHYSSRNARHVIFMEDFDA